MTESPSALYVGIDVSKASLDVGISSSKTGWSVANTPSGIGDLIAQLKPLKPTLIVVEATGGYEALVVAEVYAAKLPIARVNPGRVPVRCQVAWTTGENGSIGCTGLGAFCGDDPSRCRAITFGGCPTISRFGCTATPNSGNSHGEQNCLGTAAAHVRDHVQKHLRGSKPRSRILSVRFKTRSNIIRIGKPRPRPCELTPVWDASPRLPWSRVYPSWVN